MSLRVVSTAFHFHAGSEPNFAITTREHTQGAWVIAQNAAKQQEYYDIATDARDCGLQIVVVCDRYEDSGDARRFFLGVIEVEPNGFCDPLRFRNKLQSLPPLDLVIGKKECDAESGMPPK